MHEMCSTHYLACGKVQKTLVIARNVDTTTLGSQVLYSRSEQTYPTFQMDS